MDPFTLALATFGVQKLRGKSTRSALKSAAIVGGGAFGLGKLAPQGIGSMFTGSPLSSLGFGGAQTYGATQGLTSIPQSATYGKQFMKPEVVEQISKSSPLSKAVVGGEKTSKLGLTNILDKIKEKPFESALIGSAVLPLLQSEEDMELPFDEEDYKKAYKEQSDKLEGGFQFTDAQLPSRSDVTGSNMFYANAGGLAEMVKKYSQGGVNYLPSKVDHDENDVNNYVRAEGYVEDGAGVGDKDEDTMLAQLADGEFVSRADAVLGAGILSGADPKNFKGMRKAGADFFYTQQKQLKRVYDITNASKKN